MPNFQYLPYVPSSLLVAHLLAFWVCPSTFAQIVPDSSLGAESSRVTPDRINNLPSDRIDGGAIRGSNLFHSLQQFNIPEGRGAYFANPNGIANILTRVTGGNPSNIFGTLGVLGNANLFLINPNGIVFGPNARLDLRGSFLASSASSIEFNGFAFDTLNPQAPPLLTLNIPLGLRFRDNPGPIAVTGPGHFIGFNPEGTLDYSNRPPGLQVAPNQTLALVGGEVALTGGNLTASSGRVELGSVTGANTVNLTAPSATGGFALDYTGVNSFSDIRLAPAASVTTRGESGGPIQIQGRQIAIAQGSIVDSSNLGSGIGGNLIIRGTEAVELSGNIPGTPIPNFVLAQVQPGATGKGGDITLETQHLRVTDGAQVVTNTLGQGDAGSLTVLAQIIDLSGITPDGVLATSLLADVETEATGNGGDLRIETQRLRVVGGAQVGAGTYGAGNGGNLRAIATESIELLGTSVDGQFPSGLFASAEFPSTGDGGNMNIETPRLLMTGGAQLRTGTNGQGNGGALTVRVQTIDASGASADGRIPTALSASVGPQGTGNGSELLIEAQRLRVADGAQIGTSTVGLGNAGNATIQVSQIELSGTGFGGLRSSGLFATVEPMAVGRGGRLQIETNRLEVTNGAKVEVATYGEGDAGDLIVQASESIFLSDAPANARFASGLYGTVAVLPELGTRGTGRGGTLAIATPRLDVENGARITVSDQSGIKGAGELQINADTIRLNNGAVIEANTIAGQERQGSITLQSSNIQLRRNSSIATNAGATATGGNITINSDILVALPEENSDITANAQGGQGGRIEINVPNIFGLAALNREQLVQQLPPDSPLNPQFLSSSDITAISEAGAELSGQIIFNASGVNPAQGLVELPQNVVDPASLIAANPCVEGAESEFVVTGRGGLPPTPAQPLGDDQVRVGWSELPTESPNLSSYSTFIQTAQSAIAPARGWIMSDRGVVTLTADSSGQERSAPQSPTCSSN